MPDRESVRLSSAPRLIITASGSTWAKLYGGRAASMERLKEFQRVGKRHRASKGRRPPQAGVD